MQSTYYQSQPAWINLDGFFSLIGDFFKWIFSVHFFAFMYVLTTLLIIALITLILFLFVRMYEIRQEQKKKSAVIATPAASSVTASETISTIKENVTWQGIRERLLSSNDSDWKLATIEADIYMDRILDDKGFHGDTTSDKLKQITPDKLPSIQIAWEVHKVRNRIAHDGAAFVLTMPEARKLLSYFEIVFTDLGVI